MEVKTLKNKNKKIYFILLTFLIIISIFVSLQNIKGDFYGDHLANSYSSEQLDYVGIMANTWNTTTSNLIQSFGQSFIGTDNYLTGTSVYLKKVGGARTGFVTMAVVNATGTYGENDDLPLNMNLVLANALEISTTKVNIASVTTIGSMYRFNYTGTTLLKLGNNYTLFVYYENSTTASSDVNYIGVGLDITDSFASGRFSFKGGATGVWTIEASTKDMIYDVYGTPYYQGTEPTPTPTATPTPTPDKLTPILENTSTFLFGTTALGAGFGLIVLLICCVLCVKLGGKSFEMVLLGAIIATIVNVSTSIWEVWTIILLIIAVVAIALKNSGVLNRDGE